MKMVNKKGVTLMELVVSIAMLSVAMVLLYSLMSNIQAKKKVVTRKTDDMIKVAEIETVLQKEIAGEYNYGREKVKCVSYKDYSYANGYQGQDRAELIVKRLDNTITKYELDFKQGGIIFKINGEEKHRWTLTLNHCSVLNNGGGATFSEDEYTGPNTVIYLKRYQCDTVENQIDNYEYVKDTIKLPMAFNGPKKDNCETY